MEKIYSKISDIAIVNSKITNESDLQSLYQSGLFSDDKSWDSFLPEAKIPELGANINSRLRNRMSQLSLGIYTALDAGPGKNITSDEELSLFTGFGEIDTTREIIKNIIIDKYLLVSPTLFHNSVHHTALGYYTIIKKTNNACITISDGLDTGRSFIEYISRRAHLDKNLIVSAGEEHSDFFALDKINPKTIVPAFIAYRIKKSTDTTGFSYSGKMANLDELKKTGLYEKAENIIAGKNLFLKLKNSTSKNILTEYPIIRDNPAGIIYRLAFPSLFPLKGHSLILEECNDLIYCFEVCNG
jgi:Beta-ketoacyl synthase, N-terminal domain